jgi:hypothetical protein
MKPISKQWISKHAFTTVDLSSETVFSIQSVQSGYKEENWGNQFSWALPCKLRRDGDLVQWRVLSPAVKRRLCVCCSYNKTVIITVLKFTARKQLVKTENT